MYYPTIDYDRFPKIWSNLSKFFNLPPVIHIVGTNGKGSVGRYLAMILQKSGKKTAHFTSPHIFDFRERFWLDGRLVSNQELQNAHLRLLDYFKQTNLDPQILSYFEWACLLAAELFSGFDEIVLEAGVGGEFDGTNVFDKKLSVFTPIDLDHQNLLGDSLEQIATTKLNSMDKIAVLNNKFTLLDLAKNIAKNRNCKLIIESDELPNCIQKYAQKYDLAEFLRANLNLAYNAAKVLNIINLDEIINNLSVLDLRARLEKIQQNIWVDVGHNAHAAKAIAKYFKNQKINLIYNAFEDKDAKSVLTTLKPILQSVLIYDYPSHDRKLLTNKISNLALNLGLKCYNFERIEPNNEYLVFGSFLLVSHFLRNYV
nr:bifunctional folylpolyglutamate synthase/dihydrofolate synthase [Campylobacter sp.]